MTDTKEKIVNGMCQTMRHDFGLEKRTDSLGSCGMTDDERTYLVGIMGQVYEHYIGPVIAERDKALEALRLHRLLTGIGAREVVDELIALRADARRLKILAGEPVPPLAEEFIGPRPESIHDRLRRKISGGAETALKSTETRADQGAEGGAQ